MVPEVNDLQEEIRLAELYSYGILDTEEEEDFSQLLDLATGITGCPMAAISFIDKDRQWFKSKRNIPMRQTRRDIAFCHYTIRQDGVMLVQDAREDSRFRHSPLVTDTPHIVFYAGAPILGHTGKKLGTVCVLDSSHERELNEEQRKSLMIIANQVSRLMELKRKNQSLIKYTNRLIEAEKSLQRLSIREEESERSFIAQQLHENFAQTLAATKLYLDFAESEKDLTTTFLARSKNNIDMIIDEIKVLSNYINPVDTRQADPRFLLRDFVDQWSMGSDIEVDFTLDSPESLPTEAGLHIYRILQNLLALAQADGAKHIDIQIHRRDELEILVRYLQQEQSLQDPSKLLKLKKSISIAQAEGGRLNINTDSENYVNIYVHLPIAQPVY